MCTKQASDKCFASSSSLEDIDRAVSNFVVLSGKIDASPRED